MSKEKNDVQEPNVQSSLPEDKKEVEKISKKENGAPRYKIRSPQKSDTTWEIYQRKTKTRVESFSTGLRSMWNTFETRCGGRKKALRNVGFLAFVLLLIACSPMIYSFSKNVIKGFQIRAEVARQKEVQLNFFSHRDDITNRITKNITERQFQSAENEIAALDIPALKNELRPLKNYLSEIRTSEEADRIPENNYEKKFEAYKKLVELNSQNDTYRSKREEYRLKYADNEYIKAMAFYNKGKKDPSLLDKSLKTIEKSVELFPGYNKYHELKATLIKQKLLFYEGNDKIAMAVRDDGMGKRLFSDQRKLSVWILNKSQETVYINVQYFTMLGKNGLKYTYNDTGSKLSGKIEPGQQTWGELYFRTSTSPAKLTFNHLVCGKISREFP
jgi:tetratricopeptide (TPR) repeat protein